MGEAQIRTGYDYVLTFSITAPGNGSAYASINSLLTTAQKAEINAAQTAGFMVCGVVMTPVAAINFAHSTPGAPGTVSPNANGFPVLANQKPNEVVPCINGHTTLCVQSQTGSPVVVAIGLLCVSKDTL
jgi:hypothetical protein